MVVVLPEALGKQTVELVFQVKGMMVVGDLTVSQICEAATTVAQYQYLVPLDLPIRAVAVAAFQETTGVMVPLVVLV